MVSDTLKTAFENLSDEDKDALRPAITQMTDKIKNFGEISCLNVMAIIGADFGDELENLHQAKQQIRHASEAKRR
jgi:hypothetical protein